MWTLTLLLLLAGFVPVAIVAVWLLAQAAHLALLGLRALVCDCDDAAATRPPAGGPS